MGGNHGKVVGRCGLTAGLVLRVVWVGSRLKLEKGSDTLLFISNRNMLMEIRVGGHAQGDFDCRLRLQATGQVAVEGVESG